MVPERPDEGLLHQIIGVEVPSAELPRAPLQSTSGLRNQLLEALGPGFRWWSRAVSHLVRCIHVRVLVQRT